MLIFINTIGDKLIILTIVLNRLMDYGKNKRSN